MWQSRIHYLCFLQGACRLNYYFTNYENQLFSMLVCCLEGRPQKHPHPPTSDRHYRPTDVTDGVLWGQRLLLKSSLPHAGGRSDATSVMSVTSVPTLPTEGAFVTSRLANPLESHQHVIGIHHHATFKAPRICITVRCPNGGTNLFSF
jgi:hypothetical protein